MNRSRTTRRQSGVTLIELMIVIAIIAILAAVAISATPSGKARQARIEAQRAEEQKACVGGYLFVNDVNGVPTVQIKNDKGGGIPCTTEGVNKHEQK